MISTMLLLLLLLLLVLLLLLFASLFRLSFCFCFRFRGANGKQGYGGRVSAGIRESKRSPLAPVACLVRPWTEGTGGGAESETPDSAGNTWNYCECPWCRCRYRRVLLIPIPISIPVAQCNSGRCWDRPANAACGPPSPSGRFLPGQDPCERRPAASASRTCAICCAV